MGNQLLARILPLCCNRRWRRTPKGVLLVQIQEYGIQDMTTASSKQMIAALMLSASVFLTGCVGGTTYGTGVTAEKQLLNDLEGMITLGSNKKRKAAIDYSARPDLVLPNQTATLSAPHEQVTSTSNADWPESPEVRLARVRGEAEVDNPRNYQTSVQELKRKKTGIRIGSTRTDAYDPDKVEHVGSFKNNVEQRKKFYALKSGSKYQNSGSRKYLTEPPVAYRTPYETALSGDTGVSEKEKKRREDRQADILRREKSGQWAGF